MYSSKLMIALVLLAIKALELGNITNSTAVYKY